MFRAGDRVTAYGLIGEVSRVIEDTFTVRTVEVCFLEAGIYQWFYADGRAEAVHKEPTLRLINPPKRTVKKKLFLAVKLTPNAIGTRLAYQTSFAYPDMKDAQNQFFTDNQVVEIEVEIQE